MKVTYDPDADALSIQFKQGEVAKTKELDENTMIDLDKNGEILSLEVLFIKERNPDLLKNLRVETISA